MRLDAQAWLPSGGAGDEWTNDHSSLRVDTKTIGAGDGNRTRVVRLET